MACSFWQFPALAASEGLATSRVGIKEKEEGKERKEVLVGAGIQTKIRPGCYSQIPTPKCQWVQRKFEAKIESKTKTGLGLDFGNRAGCR